MPAGSIRCTVLIETILAAFEMEEILYELRDYGCALNAGRWDYIFSVIKKFRSREDWVLPDRVQVTMTVPFMRAYTELLVRSCHRRGAHAIGGMAAFIPSRKDAAVNEVALAKVREDKQRESGDGFDGTWVAHPDLVPVATEVFDGVLGERPNQVARLREDVVPDEAALLSDSGHARRGHGGGAAHERLRRRPLPRRVAPRRRRGGDRQSHGGRRHGRDLALAGVAVGALGPVRRGARAPGGRGAWRPVTRRRSCSRSSRSRRSSSSSSRFPRTLTWSDARQHQGRRHRARDRGGDRLRGACPGDRPPAGAALRAVQRLAHAGAGGAAAAGRARARLVRAEPRRPRPDDRAGGAARGVLGAGRAGGARDRGGRDEVHAGGAGGARGVREALLADLAGAAARASPGTSGARSWATGCARTTRSTTSSTASPRCRSSSRWRRARGGPSPGLRCGLRATTRSTGCT